MSKSRRCATTSKQYVPLRSASHMGYTCERSERKSDANETLPDVYLGFVSDEKGSVGLF